MGVQEGTISPTLSRNLELLDSVQRILPSPRGRILPQKHTQAAQKSCVITGSAVGLYSRNRKVIWRLVSDCTKKHNNTRWRRNTTQKTISLIIYILLQEFLSSPIDKTAYGTVLWYALCIVKIELDLLLQQHSMILWYHTMYGINSTWHATPKKKYIWKNDIIPRFNKA